MAQQLISLIKAVWSSRELKSHLRAGRRASKSVKTSRRFQPRPKAKISPTRLKLNE